MSDLAGHVTPGGPVWRLELPGAVLDKLSVSEMDNNVYLLTCTATGERLLVDAADDAGRIMELLTETGGDQELAQVLTTHRHWDHHRALAEVADRTGARTLAGADDADELPVRVDRRLQDGDAVMVGSLLLDVVALRGHTPGSVAVSLTAAGDVPQTVILTGDSLFPGGPGKTTSPKDFVSLVDDLEERIFGVYPDDALVLPGHGDNTTVGAERPHLDEWRQRGW
ncbi:MBL fold metallo-hydrolase [Ornithinimicrobium avium]|uniref:MBL fold metallo-hydrolase n=1 Tax=Ornithinimicrobium avium TaxID=2283195 RepID=A0A345NJC3_9MICO|nr:MBL fold metallo-hydrolase [Ornithinimicrobium avium]AXH95131.1 MBL fold metallo-hydrolase [Ornithinimicrobium avium]